MEKIIIQNIGPLKNVVIEPKKVMILIGEQGTGKSIIARVLHYGRLIEKEVNSTLFQFIKGGFHFKNEMELEIHFNHKINVFVSKLGYGYSGIITFKINNLIEISYNCLNSYINYDVNFEQLLKEKNNNPKHADSIRQFSFHPSIILPVERLTYEFLFHNKINSLKNYDNISTDFYEDFLRTLSNLYTLHPTEKDDYYKKFYELNESYFGISYSKDRIDQTKFSYYIKDKGGNPIKLDYYYLSAGFKELFTMVKITSSLLFNHTNQQFIIEEPENNLYPVTIDKLIKMLAMFSNAPEKNNSLVISTHSPYVLMSLNRLLYAGWLSKKLTNNSDVENLNKIVPEHLQLNADDFVCYNVKDGGIQSVMEDWGSGNMQISTDFINGISETLGEITDELIALDPTI